MQFVLFLVSLSLLISCGGNRSDKSHGDVNAKKNRGFFKSVGHVKPYRANAEYAEQLETCIYAETPEKSCRFSDLPLLGRDQKHISIDSILNRTLVSHKFLGTNFRKLLESIDSVELFQMFGSVNAIVISDNITPSFYLSISGAIYLSAEYFWLTKEEKKLLTKKQDFRKNLGKKFKFEFYSLYVNEKKNILRSFRNEERTIEDIKLFTTKLLYHELAHANDYFPRSFYTHLEHGNSTEDTYADISKERFINYELLSDELELKSEVLLQLGEVLFQGEKAIDSLLSLTAGEIASQFEQDNAVDEYAYSTPREDLAMQVERYLMLANHQTENIITVIKYPKNNFTPSQGYEHEIAWGEKNRVLVPRLRTRVENIMDKIFGSDMTLQSIPYSNLKLPSDIRLKDILKY